MTIKSTEVVGEEMVVMVSFPRVVTKPLAMSRWFMGALALPVELE